MNYKELRVELKTIILNISRIRIPMKHLLLIIPFAVTACQPVNNDPPQSNIRAVSQYFWQGKKPYPFNTDGELGCVDDTVYFYPRDNFDKGKEGYTLNAIPADTELYKIVKANTDLSDVIAYGKTICRDFENSLKNER